MESHTNKKLLHELQINIKILYICIFVISIFIFILFELIISFFRIGLFDYLYFIQLTHIFTSIQNFFISFDNNKNKIQESIINYTHIILDFLLSLFIFVFIILCTLQLGSPLLQNNFDFCYASILKEWFYFIVSLIYLVFDIIIITTINNKNILNKKINI